MRKRRAARQVYSRGNVARHPGNDSTTLGDRRRLETLQRERGKAPDLARVKPEATAAALVNTQSVLAIDAELKRQNKLN